MQRCNKHTNLLPNMPFCLCIISQLDVQHCSTLLNGTCGSCSAGACCTRILYPGAVCQWKAVQCPAYCTLEYIVPTKTLKPVQPSGSVMVTRTKSTPGTCSHRTHNTQSWCVATALLQPTRRLAVAPRNTPNASHGMHTTTCTPNSAAIMPAALAAT